MKKLESVQGSKTSENDAKVEPYAAAIKFLDENKFARNRKELVERRFELNKAEKECKILHTVLEETLANQKQGKGDVCTEPKLVRDLDILVREQSKGKEYNIALIKEECAFRKATIEKEENDWEVDMKNFFSLYRNYDFKDRGAEQDDKLKD